MCVTLVGSMSLSCSTQKMLTDAQTSLQVSDMQTGQSTYRDFLLCHNTDGVLASDCYAGDARCLDGFESVLWAIIDIFGQKNKR